MTVSSARYVEATYCHDEGVDKDSNCSHLYSVADQSSPYDGGCVASECELCVCVCVCVCVCPYISPLQWHHQQHALQKSIILKTFTSISAALLKNKQDLLWQSIGTKISLHFPFPSLSPLTLKNQKMKSCSSPKAAASVVPEIA